MNQVFFRRFQSARESLAASTSITLVGEVGVSLKGRQSPYISHQKVEYGAVDYVPEEGTLLVANLRHRMTVSVDPPTTNDRRWVEANLGGDIDSERFAGPPELAAEVELLPRILVAPFLDLAVQYGVIAAPWQRVMLYVSIALPVVDHWDGARPVYRIRERIETAISPKIAALQELKFEEEEE